MKTVKLLFVLFALFFFIHNAQAQEKPNSELFKTLKAKDELLFGLGFNKCEIGRFDDLVSENFEFYHDKSGITPSKEAFIKSIRDGLCKLNYKPRRELVEGSLEVYPLSDKGVLYGAIQTGAHRFYAIEKDKPEYLTSTARFMHLWRLEQGDWKLVRVLSYDHQIPTSK